MCTAYTVHALQSARGPKLRATPCPSPPLLVTVGAKATAPSRARARAQWRGWRCPRPGGVESAACGSCGVCGVRTGDGEARRRRFVGRVCRVRRRGRSVFHLNSLQMLLYSQRPRAGCRWPYAQSTIFVTRACFNISLERARGEWVRGTSRRNERSGTLFSRDRHGDLHDLIDAELRVAVRWTMARPTTAPIYSTDLQHRPCEETEEDGLGQLPQLACRATPARQGGGGSEAPRVERGARLHSGVTVSARLLMRP